MLKISRREFLQMFSMAALAAIAPLPSLGFVNQRSYISDIFGLSLDYPRSWFTLLPVERIESMKTVFGEDYDENSPVPAFQVTERQEPTIDVNPNFELWATKRENWMTDEIVAVQKQFYLNAEENLSGFKLLNDYSPIDFAGKSASYCAFQFHEDTIQGSRLHWVAQCYFVFHKDYFMIFDFKGKKADFERLKNEFSLIRSSIIFRS